MLAMFPSLIQIFVKMLTEEIVKLKVKVLLTIHDLFCTGMKLKDCKTLACYGVKDDGCCLLHFRYLLRLGLHGNTRCRAM